MPTLRAEFGVCLFTVRDILLRAGVDPRKSGPKPYPVFDGAFDHPTEEAMYWIGFLMADGCITGTNGNAICLALAERDAEHVKLFRNFVGSSAAITVHQPKNPRAQRNVSVTVRSEQMVRALGHYGVVPRKGLVAEAFGGAECNRHFWRGAVDGDGHLRLWRGNGNTYARLEFCGSKRMVEQFLGFARTVVPGCRARVRPKGKICVIQFCGSVATMVVEEMYRDCMVALPRKLDTARQIVLMGISPRSWYSRAA